MQFFWTVIIALMHIQIYCAAAAAPWMRKNIDYQSVEFQL